MTPKSRCRIRGEYLSETVDTKGPFAEEDARRSAELAELLRNDESMNRRIQQGKDAAAKGRRLTHDGLRATQVPGRCAVCREPLEPGRLRLCGNPECRREWDNAENRAYRLRVKARREAANAS